MQPICKCKLRSKNYLLCVFHQRELSMSRLFCVNTQTLTRLDRKEHAMISLQALNVCTKYMSILVSRDANLFRVPYVHMCDWMCLPRWPFLWAVKQQLCTPAAAAAALPHYTSCQIFPASLSMRVEIFYFVLLAQTKAITTHIICMQKSVSCQRMKWKRHWVPCLAFFNFMLAKHVCCRVFPRLHLRNIILP